MKKKKFMGLILSITVIMSIVTTGCGNSGSGNTTLIPEKIVDKVIDNENVSKAYYGEAKIEFYENDKKLYETTMKEWWKPKNKRRAEMISKEEGKVISTNDGKKITIYTEKTNTVMISPDLGEEEIFHRDPRKIAMDELEFINKTHTIENKGEEDINGRSVIHIQGKPKEKDSILGNVDYWIDKDNWFIVKSIIISGNSKISTEYTKLDFDIKIKDEIFTHEVPDDAKIVNLDEETKSEIMTLEEVEKKLNTKILSYKGEDFKLDRIEYLKNNPEIGEDFNQIYVDEKGIEIFTITVKKAMKLDESAEIPGEKSSIIRGKKGNEMEQNTFKSVFWEDNAVNYSIFTVAPNFTLENCKEIAEKLQ